MSAHSRRQIMENAEANCLCSPRPKAVPTHFKRKTRVYHDGNNDGTPFATEIEDSMYFFDAYEAEDDIEEELYPIITTSYVKPRLHVSMEEPESLLNQNSANDFDMSFATACDMSFAVGDHASISTRTSSLPPSTPSFRQSVKRKSLSRRFSEVVLFRRDSKLMLEGLQKPLTRVSERGYPGELTPEELQECVRALSSLRLKRKPVDV